MQIKIKRLKKDVALPTYAKLGDAAMDVVATSENVVEANDHGYIEYGTGLAFELPEGYYMDIRPRSSISNTGMILANGCGVLDQGFTGELKLRFKWIKGTKKYNVGDRVAQIMIKPYPFIEWLEVDELSKTERNEGGFGHSGK
jgi:dUTP pyrophosphatase